MIIYQLHPRGIDFRSDLYDSIKAAEQSAQLILEGYLELRVDRDTHPDDSYPVATSLVWEEGEDGFGNWIRYATFCKDWWGPPSNHSFLERSWNSRHDRFTIRSREVYSARRDPNECESCGLIRDADNRCWWCDG